MMDYEDFLISLTVDLVAISVLTYALYFRRHQRRDLTLGLVGVNVGLFAVSSFTATNSISVGFGIGLFALLSVIRLRSTTTSQEEIGYYFVALVIGLVNGLAGSDRWNVTITLNIVLLGGDVRRRPPVDVAPRRAAPGHVKGVPRPPDTLQGQLEDRLGYEVTKLRVLEIDYANKRTQVDVRINTDRPVAQRIDRKVEPARIDPHADGIDPHADGIDPHADGIDPDAARAARGTFGGGRPVTPTRRCWDSVCPSACWPSPAVPRAHPRRPRIPRRRRCRPSNRLSRSGRSAGGDRRAGGHLHDDVGAVAAGVLGAVGAAVRPDGVHEIDIEIGNDEPRTPRSAHRRPGAGAPDGRRHHGRQSRPPAQAGIGQFQGLTRSPGSASRPTSSSTA